MSPLPIRVVKVGGSLFDLVDLPDRINAWLAEQSPAHHVLVAGGGALVEQVRQWHQLQPLDDELAHWMCIDLMTVTARLLHARMPEIPLVEDDQLLRERLDKPGCTIFSSAQWLRNVEPTSQDQTLPANWDVTSDSIAAWLAIALQAERLVLLKSALPNSEASIRQVADDGLVDPYLATQAPELPTTQIVDLRNFPHRTICLHKDHS